MGFPVTCRENSDQENLIGALITTVMMRVKLTKSTSFSDILNDVKQSFLYIMEHKNIPFEYLVEKLNVKNDLSRSSLFQLMFSYVSASENIIKFDKLQTSEYLIDQFDTSKFDLTSGRL